jgi:hypothetical protein
MHAIILSVKYPRRPFEVRSLVPWLAVLAAVVVPVPGVSVAADLPPASASDRGTLTRDDPRATVEEVPGGFLLLTPPEDRPAMARDGRYQWLFPRALFLYQTASGGTAAGKGDRGWRRILTVHHAVKDADVALRTARLCARMLRLHRERFGKDAVFPRGHREAHVWLYRQTPLGPQVTLGGETRDNHVYVFATAEPRSPIEWVRTVAHEWGHLTLPAARGFSAPESDASGFLGERLYLKWLREERRAAGRDPLLDDGTDAAGLDLYHGRQVAPLIARFEKTGPDSALWDGKGEETMDLYVGAALASDQALGSRLLGDALFTILGTAPRDLLAALRTTARGASLLRVKLPAWVPLERARYEIAAPDRVTVAVAGGAPLRLSRGRPAALRVERPGWRWLRGGTGSGSGGAAAASVRVDITLRRSAFATPGIGENGTDRAAAAVGAGR